jgi:RNA polymerase sigma-70 factor (ECF subfamily)
LKGSWEAERDPLDALRRGVPGLFEDFVRSETATLVGFFRRLGADRGESEDCAQEVFVKLFQSAASYQRQGAFSSYVLRVARNAWVDRRRRAGTRAPICPLRDHASPFERERAPLADRSADAPTHLSLGEEAQRLREAVASLPPAHAVVFELALVQGLPYSEIASVVGIPVGTVKSRVFNALRKLRAILERAELDGGAAPALEEEGAA